MTKSTQVLHPWHGVETGENAPEFVNCIVEIPQGSRSKYEIDKASGLLKLDRVIYSSFHYPANYGFIPKTYGDDKDPLDILIISSMSIQPMCIVEAKVIGVMQMLDGGEGDDKIIGVAANDPAINYYENIEELPKHFFNELRHFFEQYKVLEKKSVKVEEFGNKQQALSIIKKAMESYNNLFTEEK